MSQYSVAQARHNLAKLIDSALSGEEVVITRRGKPVATLAPARDPAAADAAWARLDAVRQAGPAMPPGFDSAKLVREMRDEGP